MFYTGYALTIVVVLLLTPYLAIGLARMLRPLLMWATSG